MRKIMNLLWVDTITTDGIETLRDMDTIKILTMIVNFIPAQKMPRGLESFNIMSNIKVAFDKVTTDNRNAWIMLEEREYKFFKDLIEKYVPMAWAINPDVMKSINNFLEAKKEE